MLTHWVEATASNQGFVSYVNVVQYRLGINSRGVADEVHIPPKPIDTISEHPAFLNPTVRLENENEIGTTSQFERAFLGET